jgi:uncharacterized small protein (DUF1192 family)
VKIYEIGNLPWDDDGYVDGPGQGFHVGVGWHPELITYFAVTSEAPPYDQELVEDPELWDPETGRLQGEVLAGGEVMDVLSVEELEARIGFELPSTVREALRRDQAEHYAGRAGETREELAARLRELGRSRG